MKRVYLFLADGFEEIEGLTVVDVLRRAGIEIQMISITGKRMVTGSHGISIQADMLFEAQGLADADAYVLPGGMPGTKHLGEHMELCRLLVEAAENDKIVAAICAAPSVLGGLGLLQGKNAVCYPGFEEKLTGANVYQNETQVDQHIVTSRGMGTAIPFALTLVELLTDGETKDKIAKSIIWRQA